MKIYIYSVLNVIIWIFTWTNFCEKIRKILYYSKDVGRQTWKLSRRKPYLNGEVGEPHKSKYVTSSNKIWSNNLNGREGRKAFSFKRFFKLNLFIWYTSENLTIKRKMKSREVTKKKNQGRKKGIGIMGIKAFLNLFNLIEHTAYLWWNYTKKRLHQSYVAICGDFPGIKVKRWIFPSLYNDDKYS